MMVTNVRRIADDESRFFVIRCGRRGRRKIRESQTERRPVPQFEGMTAVMEINLVSRSGIDFGSRKLLKESRIESARAESRVQESNRGARRPLRARKAKDVGSKGRRCCELAEFIPLPLRFGGVQPILECLALGFLGVNHRSSLKSEVGEVLDAMFPNPIDTLGGFIAQVTAVKLAAQEKNVAHLLAEVAL
jgi:hypothetical protein